MLDALNAVRNLGEREFTNGDAYTFAERLEKLHPDNSDSHREQAAISARKSGSNSRFCAMRGYCFTSAAVFGACRDVMTLSA